MNGNFGGHVGGVGGGETEDVNYKKKKVSNPRKSQILANATSYLSLLKTWSVRLSTPFYQIADKSCMLDNLHVCER